VSSRKKTAEDIARAKATERLEELRAKYPEALEGIAEFLAGARPMDAAPARDEMILYVLTNPDAIGRLKWREVYELAKYHWEWMRKDSPIKYRNPRPASSSSRRKKNGLPGEPPPGVYEWDPKKFPLPPDSYEIREWRGGPRARKGNRPLIAINPCGTSNPAPSSIARGGKKLEELELALGSALFVFRADASEKNRRAVNRAMKALEQYKKAVGINPSRRSSSPASSSTRRSTRRSNPAEAISRKLPAHEVAELPNQAVILGLCLELTVKPEGRNSNVHYKYKGEECALLSDADGDALAIVCPSKVEEADPKLAPAESKKTWRRWSEFEVDAAVILKAPDKPLRHYLGRAVSIVYRSDKWTGKAIDYEHKFEKRDFQCWGDTSKGAPSAILITSFPPRRLVTARGIVG